MSLALTKSATYKSSTRAALRELARHLGSSAVAASVESVELGPRLGLVGSRKTPLLFRRCGMQVADIRDEQLHRLLRGENLFLGIAGDAYVVLKYRGWNRYRETLVENGATTHTMHSRRQLSARLTSLQVTRWLQVSRASDLDDAVSSETRLTPWKRLWALARFESRDIRVVAAYAATLGLLTLVAPVATQALVNTIAFGAVVQPLIVLTLALLMGLALAGSLAILQAYVVEVIQRRVLVRFAEDVGARLPWVSAQAKESQDLVELNNRFMDVITVQKSAAQLLLVGLGLVLQTCVGMLLLAFYHPVLLAFAILLVAGVTFVILMGRGGTRSAVIESKSKYGIIAWLDELARAPQLFTAGHGAAFAAEAIAQRVHAYVQARKTHYRHVISVLIGGITLQVLAAVALLGVGGWLVIERQLTLGQLIAAEIVVGAIAMGLGKLGSLAEKTFDLVAAGDKLGYLLDLPLRQEGTESLPTASTKGMTLASDGLRCAHQKSTSAPFSFHISAGQKILLDGPGASGKTLLLETLAGIRPPAAGSLTWDGRLQPRADALATSIFLANSEGLMAGTIFENLSLADNTLTDEGAWSALEQVGLAPALSSLGGLDCKLLPSGSPLSASQRRLLVLARALIARPRLLLVDEILDFPTEDRQEAARIYDLFVGPATPWTAIVTSRDRLLRAKMLEHQSQNNPLRCGKTADDSARAER